MTGRILLIDDEDVFREDIASLLRHEGYTCDAADCGDEGLRYARAEAPDMILCDMMMPGIAGAELVRGLATACPETPRTPRSRRRSTHSAPAPPTTSSSRWSSTTSFAKWSAAWSTGSCRRS